MDYEKKYKEALLMAEGIIRYYKEHNRDEAAIEDLEAVFPELKESEDEKIRDEILAYIGSKQDIDLNTHNKWCSWLEKQNKQIPANSAKTCKDEQKLSVLESIGEEWSEEDIDKLTTYLHEKDGGMLWRKAKETAIEICDILKPQPKQEWSKEDERIRESIIELVEWVKEQQIHTDHNTDGTKWDDMIAWLKKKGEKTVIGNGSNSASVSDGDTSVTNKEVVSQQTGWSKEDTDFKTESVRYLCNLRDTFEESKWDTKPIQRCINWLLEFPKPQFYWKPSKEQMEALNKVMEMPLHTELYLRLSELYNDLS